MESNAVIVLAGGNSSRMNFPKPWLIFEDNATFLETIINRYRNAGFKKIVILLNKTCFLTEYNDRIEFLKLTTMFVENNYPEKGRLYSLYITLKDLPSSDFAIIHNVDNPFVEDEVIHALYKERKLNGTTIPTYKQKAGHPIIIGKIVIDEVINNYEKYDTLKQLINKFDKKYVDVNNSSILININTPQDYNKVMNELV